MRSAVLWGAVLGITITTSGLAQVQKHQGGSAPVGGRTLVAMNFAGTQVGDFPNGIEPNTGNLEVVDKNGQRMLRATSESSFLVTLPELMPQDFLLEFELVPKSGHGGYDFSIEGTKDIDQGSQSIHLLWHSTNVRGVGGGGTNGFDAPMPEAVRAGLAGAPTTVVVSVTNQRIQFFANGTLTHTLPNRRFARSRILRIALGGENEDDGAVYLSSFRVAAIGAGTNFASNQNALTNGVSSNPTTTTGRAAPGSTGAVGGSTSSAVTTTSVGSRVPATSTSGTTGTTFTPPTGAARNGTTPTTIPGPATLTTKFLMDDYSGWGTLLTFTPVANATGYRVTRVQNQLNVMTGAITAATRPAIVNVTDVTAYVGASGSVAMVDPYVIPNAFYTYSVEALFSGGTASLPTSSNTQIGNWRGDPTTLPNASPIQATESAPKTTVMPGVLGMNGPQQGSDVTWTWNVPGLVLLYETSYEIVSGTASTGPIRFTVPTGIPPKQPSITLGVPAGATVKFCVALYANLNNTVPVEAACHTTTVAAAPPVHNAGPPSPASGGYRVTMTGVQVTKPTSDDLLDRDGKADEIYANAIVVRWDRQGRQSLGTSVVKSTDYGDIGTSNTWPSRIRAGTAQQTGGITSGNAVPWGFAPTAAPATPSADRFPIILWQGTLTDGGEAVVLFPSIWEMDLDPAPYLNYASNWIKNSAPVLTSQLLLNQYASTSLMMVTGPSDPGTIGQAGAGPTFTGPNYGVHVIPGLSLMTPSDRLIGMATISGTLAYPERIVVVTREKLATLQVGQYTDIPIPLVESGLGTDGIYIMYLRVERLF
jgi:hypothetical protein